MDTMHQEEQGGDVDRALEELRGRLAGSVIEPQDPLYDEARAVWNGMIDVRPRAVIRAGAVGDIDPVLDTARHTGLPLAVRGGGHNIAGHGTVDGGLVLDLGQLRGVDVDVERRLVTVEPGATLADVDSATVTHGLAVPLGVISATGVAGLTLGGGVGWLTRPGGLSLDNPVPAGLAEWPADEDLYTLCPSCGRVYRDSVIEETGTAPVAFRVDVTTGPIAEAIKVHWQLSAQD